MSDQKAGEFKKGTRLVNRRTKHVIEVVNSGLEGAVVVSCSSGKERFASRSSLRRNYRRQE